MTNEYLCIGGVIPFLFLELIVFGLPFVALLLTEKNNTCFPLWGSGNLESGVYENLETIIRTGSQPNDMAAYYFWPDCFEHLFSLN